MGHDQRALVIYRFELYAARPNGKPRKWKTFERDCADLREAVAFLYRRLERTPAELVERVGQVKLVVPVTAPGAPAR